MMNLIIGLCFGIASAAALLVMWRMTERLRQELQDRDGEPPEGKVPPREEVPGKTERGS